MPIEKISLSEILDVFCACPEGTGPLPSIMLFTEGLGLTSDMLEGVVQRCANEGYFAIAPDFFHGDVLEGRDMEAVIAKIKSIKDEEVLDETRMTIEYLKSRPDVDADRIGGIGFCMGGRLAFLAHGVFGDSIKATAAYYGGGIAPVEDRLGRKPVLDQVEKFQGPILLGYGAEDASITPDEHARIVESLSSAKKRFHFELFDEAGHAFLTESRPSYAPKAAAQAWPITFEFFDRYLKAR